MTNFASFLQVLGLSFRGVPPKEGAPIMIDDSRRGWIFEFEKDLGEDAMRRLVDAYGGLILWPPSPERAALSRLTHKIGAEAVKWLAERYGGEGLSVPNMGGAAARQAAERRAFVLAHPKASISALAKEAGLSTRRIYQIRKDYSDCVKTSGAAPESRPSEGASSCAPSPQAV